MRLAIVVAAALIGMSAPVVAQMPPPATGEMPDGAGWHGNPMFAGMSDAGRATMRAALKGADAAGGRAGIDAARDRMLAILDADRLDVGALRRAMEDEREAANAAKARHQAALIAGFQQLSRADRHAFAVNARAMRTRMESRMGGPRGHGGMIPPQP